MSRRRSRHGSRVRRLLGSVLAAVVVAAGLTAVTAPPAGAARETFYVPPTGNLTVFGRGFGHGRGMSQYGAQGAAQAGLTSAQILNFYYPGTTSAATSGTIRVWITGDTTSNIWVLATPGLRIRNLGNNAVYTLPVNSAFRHWVIEPNGASGTRLAVYSTVDGAWHPWASFAGMTRFEGPPVLQLVTGSGVVAYRGALRAADRAGATLDTVNDLEVDSYVRGVVPKEAITSWRPAALQAQAVAARTYGVSKRVSPSTRDYDLCDTTACQVYGGYSAEVASTTAAVTATSHLIRTYGNQPILAEFSSSNGGYTAPGPVPYQVGKADPYDGRPGNGNHNYTWTVSVNRATAQAGFGVGTIKALTIAEQNGLGTWGGRVLRVDVTGTTATRSFTGDQVRTLLGLKSAWFRFDHSQIIKRWLAIGANSSPVGGIASYEWPARGGSYQVFTKGTIYRGAAGAWEVHGGFITRYRAIGGPDHPIGMPVAARQSGAVPGSLLQRFSNGRLYFHTAICQTTSPVGVCEVFGAIHLKYAQLGLEGGSLGLPTQPQVPWAAGPGQLQRFQHGCIRWLAATGAMDVVPSCP